MQSLVSAIECSKWRETLVEFGELDGTFLPEYHLAYAGRTGRSEAFIWHFSRNGMHFAYPFIKTPVVIGDLELPYSDISSVYGYTGPIATTQDTTFLKEAWQAFDEEAARQNIVAEFTRFSPFNKNEIFAHPQTSVIANRTLAASYLPESRELLIASLGSKTRNMLRKAEREGLTARQLDLPENLPAFRLLYDETMLRNHAPEFFLYDDTYWHHLLSLGKNGLKLFGAFAGEKMVAASMAISNGKSGLYHLGASLTEFAKLGAGNLSIFSMSQGLMDCGVTFINMTGGRTDHAEDPLLLFKRSNANATVTFHIGKRILNPDAYNYIATKWQQLNGVSPDSGKLVFWRH